MLSIELPDTEWDTVSGLVFNICQHVPYEGEHIVYKNLDFLVEKVVGQRILSVYLTKSVVNEIDDNELEVDEKLIIAVESPSSDYSTSEEA